MSGQIPQNYDRVRLPHPLSDGQTTQFTFRTKTNPAKVLSPGKQLPDCKRVIVLVPFAGEIQDTALAERIRRLASPARVPVLYLSIVDAYELDMSARRRLSLLAALTRDKRCLVKTQVLHTSNWAKAIRSICQPGDLVLAHAEQQTKKGLFGSEPLSGQLSKGLSTPVELLYGYCQEYPHRPFPLFHWVISVILLGLILVGFFALDAQVIDQTRGGIQQVVLLILLSFEMGAVWLWNEWVR